MSIKQTVATITTPDQRTRTATRQVPLPLLVEHPEAVSAVEYLDGWVPNSYRWPAPGKCRLWEINDDTGEWTVSGESSYDRKRSYGRGPVYVIFSASGGRLASR